MFRRLLGFVIAATVLLGTAAAYLFVNAPARELDFVGVTGNAERGAYALRLGGCVTCHTKEDGGAFLAGGGAIETPFGDYYPPNITSDSEFGIGDWTLDEFAEALVNGRGPDNRHYAPTFPFTSYVKMFEQDVADLYAYLQTVEPVNQATSDHQLKFMAKIPFAMGIWKSMGFDARAFVPDESQSDAWNRGAYIVNGPGHCGECHTPRDVIGRLSSERPLAGSVLLPSKEKVPPITPEALRERGWTTRGMPLSFKFGVMPDGDVMGGSMGEVISDDLSHLNDADLSAIATYLLDQ